MKNTSFFLAFVMSQVLAALVAADARCDSAKHVPGYRGEIDRLEVVDEGLPKEIVPLGQLTQPKDLSLEEMAAKAMHYLIHNPLPDHNYECRFDIQLSMLPPSMYPGSRDPYITFGDTESRMDYAFVYMREMTGSQEGREVEEAIRRRILGYIRDDGLCWVPPYAETCDLSDPEPCATNWTTGKAVMTLTELYDRRHAAHDLALAKKLVGGLQNLASWDTGRAYYPGGGGGWRKTGWIKRDVPGNYSCILDPIARYLEVTKDQEVRHFADAFADGMIAGLQTNLGDNRIRDDGSFAGSNSHIRMHATAGVTHLGVLTANARYLEWSRKVYDWLISQGTDWGWFPESPGDKVSETCAMADMVNVAAYLAKAGYSRYWDDVERFVRNYCCESQFFVTPEYEAFYRSAYKDDPKVEEGLRQARDFQGGFMARLTPNSLTMPGGVLSMMGCCPPEAMRAIYIAWRNVVSESKEGVFVNLCFNRDAPQAKIVSFAPRTGRMTVVAKKSAHFFLRPPSWTPRNRVIAYRGSTKIEAKWKGDYIQFQDAKPGEELTITYPPVRFRQTISVAGGKYSYQWLGNTVLAVAPQGAGLPLFSKAPRELPAIASQP